MSGEVTDTMDCVTLSPWRTRSAKARHDVSLEESDAGAEAEDKIPSKIGMAELTGRWKSGRSLMRAKHSGVMVRRLSTVARSVFSKNGSRQKSRAN